MRRALLLTACALASLTPISCTEQEKETVSLMSEPTEPQESKKEAPAAKPDAAKLRKATFGAGCFWCVEAVFQRLKGVTKVESGYSGGHVDNPTYKQICTGTTGHAEVCQLTYDPGKVKFAQLLEVFWKTHDPTTKDRQGNDIGPQYRSVVFYHDDEQKKLAEEIKKKLDASGAWDRPIVTEISPARKFYKAEEEHQNYFNLNPNTGYCQFVIVPKLKKFTEVFKDMLKDEK